MNRPHENEIGLLLSPVYHPLCQVQIRLKRDTEGGHIINEQPLTVIKVEGKRVYDNTINRQYL